MNATSLFGLLLAVPGDTWLLPNGAVAEVLSRDRLQPGPGPGGRVGTVDWQGQPLPVVHPGALLGEHAASLPPKGRVVVVYAPHPDGPPARLGLLAQGHPHLVTLHRGALLPADWRSEAEAAWLLARCRLASQNVGIPDLAALHRAALPDTA